MEKKLGQHESGIGLRPALSRCCISPSDFQLLFVQTQIHFEVTFAGKNGHLFTYIEFIADQVADQQKVGTWQEQNRT